MFCMSSIMGTIYINFWDRSQIETPSAIFHRVRLQDHHIRHGKSSNNTYQCKSYSGHKKTSSCKPFTICTTNGLIVDVYGLYNANQNDAAVLRNVLQNPDGHSRLLQKGDVFIVDRGFRDVKQFLEELGYSVLMPALQSGDIQLTATDARRQLLQICN